VAIKNDRWIRRMAIEHKMIDPFVDYDGKRKGVISFGLSSYGYDLRVADEYKVFTNVRSSLVDPKEFSPDSFVDFKGDCLHHPAQLLRAGAQHRALQHPAQRPGCVHRQEQLRALRHHLQHHAARAPVGRDADARDLEHHALPAKIYSHEGLAQVLFFESDEECEQAYADRSGKYMHQVRHPPCRASV
jgi:dCTP deaminase